MTAGGGSLEERLAALHAEGLFRHRHAIESAQGPVVHLDGRSLLNFCSNDYLGLAGDRRLVRALQQAAEDFGVGSGASAMVCGRSIAHARLEERIAGITGRDRAILFSSGYLANLALVNALAGHGRGLVAADRLNHASLLDAALIAHSRLRRYAHADATALRKILESAKETPKLVLTDGVFSMDGDLAPLPELARVSAEAGATLVVDDAHGFGVLGTHGAGSLEHWDLDQHEVPVLVATFGKALGTAGAFVAGPDAMIETLVQHGRTYMYSTAPPPALAQATLAAIDLVRDHPLMRHTLETLIGHFRHGAAAREIPLTPSTTPIQPLVLGAAERASAVSAALLERGVLVTAIRPPTVPRGTARLRITLTARHTEQQIDTLLDALAESLQGS